MSAPGRAGTPPAVRRPELWIRGGAEAEEVAAVLAVLAAWSPAGAPPGLSGLAAWRAGRRTALARTTRAGQPVRTVRGRRGGGA
jgi:hypothetical protein